MLDPLVIHSRSSYLAKLIVQICFAGILTACSTDPKESLYSPATGPGFHAEDEQMYFSSIEEMDRTWQAAMVKMPDGRGGVLSTDTASLDSGLVDPGQLHPVVVWMHGCNGFWSGTNFRMDWLARNGFVVVAPLSFARSFYPTSCNTGTFQSGLYRPTLKIRQYDADYAIRKVRSFPWADQNNIFLAGLSEGAAVTTTYTSFDLQLPPLKGRIAEAWGCHSGWPEFIGINAPEDEPVLTLLADRDPWYTEAYQQGDCGEFMTGNNSSLSFVADYEPVRNMHELWEQPQVQEIILNFLLDLLQRR